MPAWLSRGADASLTISIYGCIIVFVSVPVCVLGGRHYPLSESIIHHSNLQINLRFTLLMKFLLKTVSPYIPEVQLYWLLLVRWIVEKRLARSRSSAQELFVGRQANHRSLLSPAPITAEETALEERFTPLADRKKALDEQILALQNELNIKPTEVL